VLALAAAWDTNVQAQTQVTGLSTRAVGGVSIDAQGVARNATLDESGRLQQERADLLGNVPRGLDEATQMRKVSLRRLDEAIAEHLASGKPLPAEVACLGGLQAIRYVLVYPEQQDIVLVGPAEAWKVDDRGAVVGVTTGRPVMFLDDLIVPLRSATGPARHVITCSIDPTPEGIQRLQAFTRRLRTIGNPQQTAAGIEQQLGPQMISVGGVPETSHFARVLVAADYQMKRVGMGIDPAPIRGLPPFTALMRATGRGTSNALPRWWLAPDYEPLLRDADGLAWELRGASVKAVAESDFFAGGQRQKTVRPDPASQRWAQTMTERYDDLALAEPVFAQLRNCMDLAVVAALIVGENLTQKAQVELPTLLGADSLQAAQFPAAKQVAPKAVALKKGRNWMIPCGGIQINAWEMVQQAQKSESLASVRSKPARFEQWWD
jgi:hypothetical protein